MSERNDYIEVLLDTVHVAFRADHVRRVIRCVASQPVPGAPRCLVGMMDVAGTAVPLYDARRLMGLPTRAPRAADRILLTHSPAAGLVVDDVVAVFSSALEQAPRDFPAASAGVRGVVHGPNGKLMVHDIGRMMAIVHAVPLAVEGPRHA